MRAKLSILGLYQYAPHIFDELVLPEPLQTRRQDIIDTICLELAELEILYPSAHIMQAAIGLWSRAQLPVWDKLWATTQYKYEAIHNYDRTEEHTERETRARTGEEKTTSSSSGSGSAKMVDVEINYSKGFNEGELAKRDSTDTQHVGTSSGSGTVDNTGKTADNETVEHTTSVRAFGNIGVTTTQQMIEEERKVVQFTLIEHIVDAFKQRFCLLVY